MNQQKSKITADTWLIEADTWPGANPEQIANRMDYVLLVFAQCFGSEILQEKNVNLVNSTVGPPRTCPKRLNPKQGIEYMVILQNPGGFSPQFYFQAAHGFSHVFMDCYPESKFIEWLPECLCAAASFYVLKRLSFMIQTEKELLSNYLVTLTSEAEQKKSKWGSLSKYYAAHKNEFANDPYNRSKNDVVGLWFLEIIEKNPRGWKCIAQMNDTSIKTKTWASTHEATKVFCRQWRDRCKIKEEKRFVVDLLKALGIKL